MRILDDFIQFCIILGIIGGFWEDVSGGCLCGKLVTTNLAGVVVAIIFGRKFWRSVVGVPVFV